KLDELRVIAGSDLTKYLLTPEQEFVECSAVLAMRSGAKLPSRKQLGVSNLSYILGLLDSIGELKRSVFDAIRKNDFSTAEDLFRSMEQLYLLLSPFAVYDNIAQGVKRKLDVARILIEDTRATITEEARMREFITAVNKLSERLGEVKN
ncbi:MAG: RNA-binding protein, partial [Nitrososphaerales archaeon]